MRGKVEVEVADELTAGITPAYAGKSDLRCVVAVVIQDHPRICGEKVLLYLKSLSQLGITPAYAGKRYFCT